MIEPAIIFENDNCIVINKPSGLLVHEATQIDNAPTVADWAVLYYPPIQDVGEPLHVSPTTTIQRPGIVHRLDRETSGLMILAKNQKTFLFLKEQFKKREITKEYRAFLYGLLKHPRGTVEKPLTRGKTDFRKQVIANPGQGKYALTEFYVKHATKKASYVVFFPKTGRLHQIRAHAVSLGHPVVGDTHYAQGIKPILGFTRLALHAYRLEIYIAPDEKKTFIAQEPADFEAAKSLLY